MKKGGDLVGWRKIKEYLYKQCNAEISGYAVSRLKQEFQNMKGYTISTGYDLEILEIFPTVILILD